MFCGVEGVINTKLSVGVFLPSGQSGVRNAHLSLKVSLLVSVGVCLCVKKKPRQRR